VTQIRVFLADDHPIARGGLRGLLEAAVDIEVVGEADDGTEALRLVQLIEPDVLLLDMEMPGLTGVEVAQQLRAVGSSVRILVLSAHDDPMYIKGLFGLGVEGYLVKEEILSTIVEAIRGVVQGEKGWVSRQVAAQLSTWVQNGPQTAILLSPREQEVLKLVVAGQTNKAIGRNLGISEKTVEKHLGSIFTKSQVRSRVEAAVWAVRVGVV
jgi:DNA-binding NarL/FixJ family response regulator